MNTQNLNRMLLSGFLLVLVLLAACRQQSVGGGGAALPTLTPTPRSTPLPAVATAIPPGAEGNALRMVIRPDGSMSAARSATADIEVALLEQSGLVVRIEIVERYAEALAALCESSGGQVSVAWLNAPTYVAAAARNCGVPVLQVERGSRGNAHVGEAASILVNRDANISTLSALRGKTFCRLGSEDFYSWFAPALLLRANGLNPVADIGEIAEYDDFVSLVEGVAAGDCDVTGMGENALDRFAADLGDAVDEVEVLTTSSVEFPYSVLLVPAEVSLGTRLSLEDALVALSGNSAMAVNLRALLGQNALLPATGEDFAELNEFMLSTGMDFAQLGD